MEKKTNKLRSLYQPDPKEERSRCPEKPERGLISGVLSCSVMCFEKKNLTQS